MTDQEKKIVRKTARALLLAGYDLGVFDGEQMTVPRTRSIETVMGALGTTEMDTLRVLEPAGDRIASVLLIWGNGEDVISDIAAPTEEQMEMVEGIIQKAFDG
jgi:hypothetical protein